MCGAPCPQAVHTPQLLQLQHTRSQLLPSEKLATHQAGELGSHCDLHPSQATCARQPPQPKATQQALHRRRHQALLGCQLVGPQRFAL